MALYALGSSVSAAFPVWSPFFKTSNRGNTVPRGVEERELCIDLKRCCQQRRAFCPNTWPHYFRVMWREPSWRLFWGPAVFHMTSHTSHSSALISRQPFLFVRVSHANFQTSLPHPRLDDISPMSDQMGRNNYDCLKWGRVTATGLMSTAESRG